MGRINISDKLLNGLMRRQRKPSKVQMISALFHLVLLRTKIPSVISSLESSKLTGTPHLTAGKP